MAGKLRILHCLRAPVGGLFRHVVDLARAQTDAGHDVGLIADSTTGGEAAIGKFAAIKPTLRLGVTRVAMPRSLGFADYTAFAATHALARGLNVDILHGHGAKGGAYARLAGRKLRTNGLPVRVLYTPHGGSLHYSPGSPEGLIFLGLERHLAQMTDGLIFESDYSRRIYEQKVGTPPCAVRVIPNGLLPEDFSEHRPAADAADVVFIGELRRLKGVDVLLQALARVTTPRALTAVIVGAGPDEQEFRSLSETLGLGARVRFAGAMPAARAFPLGRLLAVPSRAESFPYIVLEGAAAGIPMLASNVGGIPEITEGTGTRLLMPGSAEDLGRRLAEFLAGPEALLATAAALKRRVAERFTVKRMADDVLALYSDLPGLTAPLSVEANILPSG